MYDSDEVRDAVRREMRGMMFTPGAAGLPAEELAAFGDARGMFGRELQAALVEYVREMDERARVDVVALVERVAEEFEKAVRPLLEALGVALRNACEWLQEFGSRIIDGVVSGLGEQSNEGDGFPWRRRPRVAEVRVVDAVAAGRGPVMSMRTRIRGGRR